MRLLDSVWCWFIVLVGMKQSGAPLGDVVLPPWAKGDAREFIRAHREVSCSMQSVYKS